MTSEITKPTLRIIDANLNRLGEGLRVLEDIARMLLDDTNLTQQLKTMRHDLIRGDLPFHQQLLQSRNSADDVGVSLEVSGEEKQKDLPIVLVANAHRAQESLRVLEEMAKLPGMPLDSEKFKQARFNLYTIERSLLSRLLRQDKRQQISGLYVIVDTQSLRGLTHLHLAHQAIGGGARVIQLRDKLMSKKELLPVAQQMRDLCARHKVLFIINDYLDLVLATGADGVHLGQDDLPMSIARQALPIDKIVGCSATTFDQAIVAAAAGADYIGVGAIYSTSSKDNIDVCGLTVLRQVKQTVKIPVVAIGGINYKNIKAVIAAGADAVAVISAISHAENPETATRELVGLIQR